LRGGADVQNSAAKVGDLTGGATAVLPRKYFVRKDEKWKLIERSLELGDFLTCRRLARFKAYPIVTSTNGQQYTRLASHYNRHYQIWQTLKRYSRISQMNTTDSNQVFVPLIPKH
jgi:hypothetical protein